MKQIWIDELSDVIFGVKTKPEMVEFLKGLLTEGELEELARRIQIVKKLKSGMSQHEIAKTLKVGVATVTRGSKELKKGRFKNVARSKIVRSA